MSVVKYIDPNRGNDVTGDGTHKNPYETPERALKDYQKGTYMTVRWNSVLVDIYPADDKFRGMVQGIASFTGPYLNRPR